MPSTSATPILLEHLKAQLELWSPTLPLGIGYSGGKDSGVLLWALSELVPSSQLQALHVDHGWRSQEERSDEAALVEAWCAARRVPLQNFGPPMENRFTEAGARDHRYACFQSFLNTHQESPIFLAHHADDQAETVLMRLLKGRSWQGLAGMAPRRGSYLRPFLALRAALLAQVAEEQKIPFHEDSTNPQVFPTRNFLRHSIFPLLEERFPRAVDSLNDFSKIWPQAEMLVKPESFWRLSGSGGTVLLKDWDHWSEIERQAQLLAVATAVEGSPRLSRRFLEIAAQKGHQTPVQGGGWAWSRSAVAVHWERVVHLPLKEYFILAEKGNWYDLGLYRMCWSKTMEKKADAAVLALPNVDPEQVLVWRSIAPGMVFSSADDLNWSRKKRQRRLGNVNQTRCAMVLQQGLLRAVIDPLEQRVLWTESLPGKLNKSGIFVTLESVTSKKRSEYER